mgnify:CR=1 FL=1
MIFHQVATERGCQSYLLGCPETCMAVVIDPEIHEIERYRGLAAQSRLRIRYVLDTHTHADHFSAADELAAELEVPVIMHRYSPAPYVGMAVDDGEIVYVGNLAPDVTEQTLVDIFGEFGDVASVKVMWPRTKEEHDKKKNCGFVSYMRRQDAEDALRELSGALRRSCQL